MKQLLNAFYPKGKFNNTLRDKNNTQQQIVVQKTYENVYNAFVEGRFETAKEEK